MPSPATMSDRRVDQAVEIAAEAFGIDGRKLAPSLDQRERIDSSASQWSEFRNRPARLGDGDLLSGLYAGDHFAPFVPQIAYRYVTHRESTYHM